MTSSSSPQLHTITMNQPFITDDFLLTTRFARTLYHDYAARQPIIDYHCHLSPQDIADNRQFEDITSIWLTGDHYKWRAMRTLGIDEKYITGNASNREKFDKWAYTVPYTMRNPLYHWTHLELLRYFSIDKLLDNHTSSEIYNITSEKLKQPEYRTRELLVGMNVKVICTTDDPIDSLVYHQHIQNENFQIKVIPAFRPDKAYAVENLPSYNVYLDKLSQAAGVNITSHAALLEALENRIHYFHVSGCRLSDHGLEHMYYASPESHSIEKIFDKIIASNPLSESEIHYYKYITLLELCRMYHKRGWTQQFHLGALRNNNSRMLKTLGPDTGFDSVGDFSQATNLSRFLNELDTTNQLCKTILYNLNPGDNEVMATMIGNFNDGSVKGKMQFGSGWWFLDQKDGMEKQINSLSNMGLLSCFVGMLTDSRSFLSYPRHEYFRRVLCNLIGKDVENGELPADEKWLGKLVSDICYNNANEYFQF
jgi:glucuronate isomerase